MSRALIISFIVILFLGVACPSFATTSPTLELETAVYFLTPSGEMVSVGPGTYTLEKARTG